MVSIPATAPAEAEAGASAYPSAPRGWWTVGVLTGLYAVSLLDRQVFNLLVDPIGKSLQVNDFELSLLSGFAFAAFYASFGILFGWAADRFDRRGLIVGGVAIWSIATGACGLARNFWQFAFARFSVGGGEAALNPAAYSIISDSIPRGRLSLALSIFAGGAMLGSLLSKLFAASLMAIIPEGGLVLPVVGRQEPWRVVYIVVGLPGLLLGLLAWTFPEPYRHQRFAEATRTNFAKALGFMTRRGRFYGWYFLGGSLNAAANFAFATWAPAYLMRVFDLSVTKAGFLMAPIIIVPQLTGLLIAGLLADRLFVRGSRDVHLKLIMVMGGLKAVVLGFAMSGQFPLLVTATLMGLATLFSGSAGAAAAVLQLVTPNEYRGQVSSTNLFVTSLVGMGCGPMIAGALTTFVFQDPEKVGLAIAATFIGLQPFVALCLWRALKGVRAAVDESQAWANS
jgi:MFS family permease